MSNKLLTRVNVQLVGRTGHIDAMCAIIFKTSNLVEGKYPKWWLLRQVRSCGLLHRWFFKIKILRYSFNLLTIIFCNFLHFCKPDSFDKDTRFSNYDCLNRKFWILLKLSIAFSKLYFKSMSRKVHFPRKPHLHDAESCYSTKYFRFFLFLHISKC